MAEDSKAIKAPIVLDPDSDELYAHVPPTPTDPGFRRGLYVMLVVLGVLAAAGLVASREAGESLREAQDQRVELERQLNELIEAQSQMEQRDEALERLLVGLLSRSEDPAVRDAFGEVARNLGVDPSRPETIVDPEMVPSSGTEPVPVPSPAGRPSSSPSPQRPPSSTPTSDPSPTPDPSPSPQPSPQPPLLSVPLPEPLPDVVIPQLPTLGVG